MKIIAILVLIFGVALAGGAIYFASTYFDEFERRMAQRGDAGPKMVNIVVAKSQLRYGAVLDGKDLRWQAWPEDSLPQGAFTKAEDLLGNKDTPQKERMRVVLRQIEPGEPILESKVSGFGARQRLAMQLAEGKRAFTIRVDSVSGVAGFINPGDRVDVLMIRNSGRGNLESNVVLQNVLVIAVDHDTNQEAHRPKNASTATVEVTPTEAQKLTLAQNLGRLSLTLRALENHSAEGEAPPAPVDVRDLFGIEDAPAPAPQRERSSTSVTVRKAGEITGRLKFQDGD